MTRTETAQAPTTTINLPGAFCGFFEGTGLAQGQDNSDPECKAAHTAWTERRHIRAGRGFYVRVEANATVLRLLAEYAGYCLDANADEPDRREIEAARKVIERVKAARTALREQKADQAEQEAAATPAPVTVYVTTQDGERIEYAYIPNGDPTRVAHFLTAARAVPTYTDASTEQAPTGTIGESSDPYPARNTMGRCTHGYTCRFHRPTVACGIWIHPDRTTCTATPTVHVTWTDTVKGHHHATITLPGGARARITYAPKGTAYTFLGKASMGTGAPTVARARTLADLVTQYARMSGYTSARIEEYGTPEHPARNA